MRDTVNNFSIFILLIIGLSFIATTTAMAQSTRTITINNNCSDTIHVGAFPSVTSVLVGPTAVTTLGGWTMASGDTATVTVPNNWNSGRFWARTGCNFATGTTPVICPTPGPGNTPPANCCDTGGCFNSDNNYGLNCAQSGGPPATLAEFTFTPGAQDNYDVSMVDGGNISVDILPDPSTYDCSTDQNCIFTGTLPNGKTTCTQDSDCWALFGFGYQFKCDTTLQQCVNPYRCGSPGCSDTNGCAPDGITQSLLAGCTWDSGSDSVLAIPKSTCPTELQFTDTQNQGSTYVGCIAPQKFCRTACTSNAQCPAPFTCGTTSGFCERSNGDILGADCDTASIPCSSNSDCVSPATCVNNVCTGGSATTYQDLWQCTGTNAGSCFTTGSTDPNCCGCPSWAPGFPTGACVAGNNPEWHTVAEPIWEVFNDACDSAYSFPYDDTIKLFTCIGSGGGVVNYTVNFCCVNADGDSLCNDDDADGDNDGIPNDTETISSIVSMNLASSRQGPPTNDFDNDNILNHLDLDSDGDGIPDHTECNGSNDQNRDGVSDNFFDTDSDGHHDLHDPDQQGLVLICVDTDGDGNPDYLDHDSDDDGKTDANEAGGTDQNQDGILDNASDRNHDGLADSVEPDEGGTPLPVPDSDGDGTADFRDADSGTGNNGCAIASPQTGFLPNALYLIIPALILWRRLLREDRS